ncbi:hypothetical protein ABT337_03150 [Saccharopolyspora hirsuta]|uniref:Uncharacterized protein n=1 Tax=Saccharopolyspora hirsuta TaxID=1837 RepID=A0A5M7BPJ1_SACHI|nr:hypothetical protein [Saccharopolyspora hirsuta]KAA5828295.1 hypothetical protein F1721_28000 [Saccharopolyspora hirsuta]
MTSHPDADHVLRALRAQLRSTIPALIVRPDSIEVQALLVDLAKATDHAADLLAEAAPEALSALRRALDHAAAEQPEECAAELVAAHYHLST